MRLGALLLLALLICGAVPLSAADLIYNFQLSINPGWAMTGDWQFGTQTGGGADPVGGFTGDDVYATVLNGAITWWQPAQYLTTGPLDCSQLTGTRLRFQRWLGIYRYDRVAIQVSNNGSTWQTVWANPADADIFDTAWKLCEYDISAAADGHATVYIRWVLGPTEDNTATGWTIDDIEILGETPQVPLQILAWVPYTDTTREYPNTLAALSSCYPNYAVTESLTTDPGVLGLELEGKHVFLVPEQEQATREELEAVGSALGPVLWDFVENGGTVIVCGEQTWSDVADWAGFMTATGLMTADYAGVYNAGETLPVVAPDHPLVEGVSEPVHAMDATGVYTIGPEATAVVEDSLGNAAVAYRDIGYGAAIMLGYDFWAYDGNAAQILANSVQYPRSAIPILIYDDGTVQHTAVEAAQRLGLSYVQADTATFNTALTGSDWEAVVVDCPSAAPAEGWTDLVNYVDSGGHAALSTWQLTDQYKLDLAAAFGVASDESLTVLPSVFRWEPEHPLFDGVQDVPNLAEWNDGWILDADRLVLTDSTSRAVAGFAMPVTPSEAAVVISNHSRTVINGFLWDEHNQDADGDGIEDCVELVMNEMLMLLRSPHADFAADAVIGAAPMEVHFSDLSEGTPEWWTWAFGNGDSSDEQNPVYEYPAPGTYTVTLTVGNLYGDDSLTKTGYMRVGLAPEVSFEATPTAGIVPLPVSFTDLSTNGPSSWSWSFGDGASSTDQHPDHTYSKVGLYTVTLTAVNEYASPSATKIRYIAVGFPDAGPSHWAFRPIIACFSAGIVAGYLDGNYHPEIPVSRDQMAVYVSRALAGGDEHVPSGPATAHFPDVPLDFWAFKYVEYAFANSIVTGYPDGWYHPADVVDRGQMAVFIARAIVTPTGDEGLEGYTPPDTPTFPDVPTGFWAYQYIEYIADPERGVTGGYPDGRYHPEYPCSRDQMAVYVQRAFKLPI
jgi:PKD repeat protein